MTDETQPLRITLRGHWPTHMDKDEAGICNRLITSIFGMDYLVRVREGEEGEVMCPPTKDRAAIQRETHATCITLYDVMQDMRHREGAKADRPFVRVGTFVLIHGNGADLISDYSWHPQVPEAEALMDTLCKPAQDFADTL